MKKIFSQYKFLSLFALLITGNVFSQSIVVSANNTNFQVATTTNVETANTITSSFTVSINSRNKNYDLSIGTTATAFSPSTAAFATIPFSVKLRSITGVATTGAVTSTVPLAKYPPTMNSLATNATQTSNTNTAVWTYDLIMDPIGYTIPPGTYNFTITVQFQDGSRTLSNNFTITLTVLSVLDLSVTQNAPTSIGFTTSGQYANGITYSNFTTHTIKSNLPWMVNVSSQSTYFTPASSGADNNVPCSIIGVKPSTVSTFTSLSISNAVVKTGGAGNSTAAGNSYNVDLQINPGYNYSAGIYNLGLTYTLTAQ